jgi:putative membrane protein
VREPGVEDATRRTRLANERTYLAWWRTGLTSLAVAVGVGRVVPEVSHSHVARWPYEVVGAAFGFLGIAFIAIGYARARAVESALDRGGFASFGARLSLTLLIAGLVLGGAMVLIVIFAH